MRSSSRPRPVQTWRGFTEKTKKSFGGLTVHLVTLLGRSQHPLYGGQLLAQLLGVGALGLEVRETISRQSEPGTPGPRQAYRCIVLVLLEPCGLGALEGILAVTVFVANALVET